MNVSKLFRLLFARVYMAPIVDGEGGGAPEPLPTPQLSSRQAAMQQVVANAQRNLAPDLADFDEETGTSSPRDPIPEPEPEPEPDDSVITAPPEPQADPEPPKPRMVPIVVDGQTIEVDETRIIEAGKRTLQKESAADRRLQEANEILNRARAQQPRAQDPANPNQPEPSQDAQQPPSQATNGLQDPEALIDAIGQSVTQRVLESIKSQNAVAEFRKEFADIASDPYLWQIAVQLENERLQEATALREAPGDALEAYRKHGEAIRAWRGKQAPAPAAPAVPADKQERKRTITAIPAVNAKAPAPQQPKTLTTAQQIEQMRQARKQGRPINPSASR
jgi:hypothetical protein